jgi:flagellar capping protein FliD
VSGFTLSANPTTQRSWSLLGLEVQRDGSVSVNSARLDEFLSGTGGLSVAEAASFGSGAAMLSNGFSTSALATMLNTFRGTTGSLQSTLDYMNVSKQSLAREKTAETARLERTRAALVRKYSAVDAQLTKMNQMRSNIGAALSRVAG